VPVAIKLALMLGVMELCSHTLPLREGLLECVSRYGMGSYLAVDVIFQA